MGDGRKPYYKPVDSEWVYAEILNRIGTDKVGKIQLRTYIDETQYCIQNYINRGFVPEPLKYVVVNLTLDLLKSQALNGLIEDDTLGDVGAGSIASIKDGDSEIKFATSKTSTGAHVGDVDSLLYNYTTQLNTFRINKW